jgi:two-component system cell cycle response regulator
MTEISTDSPSPKVVLVDDDLSVLRLLSRALEQSGREVVTCVDAETARVRLQEEPWDVAILDRRLPDGDGALLCQEIKSDSALQHRYVMLLTAESSARKKVEGFEFGADDYITKPFDIDEVIARVRVGERVVGLQQQLVESNRQLKQLSQTDSLTGLPNRRMFQHELTRAFEHAQRYERPLAVAIIDMDWFKRINDRQGHLAGDQVLRERAALFAQSVRASDTMARLGGEEFGVILPETGVIEALHFAEKLRNLVEESPVRLWEELFPATVSIGVSAMPHTRFHSVREMMHAADMALFRAKAGGRNCIGVEKRRAIRPK